jgi:hypothetical protein
MDISKKYRLEFLKGCHRDTHELYALKSNWIALNKIFEKVDEWQDSKYREHIVTSAGAFRIIRLLVNPFSGDRVTFPEPTGIRVNMMPIKLRDGTTIPDFCRPYMGMINTVRWHQQLLDPDHVAYLTIDESVVEPGDSQRRPGLHIERPGRIVHGGRVVREGEDGFRELAWGLGLWMSGKQGYPVDGIYMASNVAKSCAIYPLQITSPSNVVDEHGGVEHMRHLLGEPQLLDQGELCWFTDTTPHESLPIAGDAPVHRSFFRIVVGRISVWYSKHNTPNPTGLAPDAPISDDDKWGAGLPLMPSS